MNSIIVIVLLSVFAIHNISAGETTLNNPKAATSSEKQNNSKSAASNEKENNSKSAASDKTPNNSKADDEDDDDDYDSDEDTIITVISEEDARNLLKTIRDVLKGKLTDEVMTELKKLSPYSEDKIDEIQDIITSAIAPLVKNDAIKSWDISEQSLIDICENKNDPDFQEKFKKALLKELDEGVEPELNDGNVRGFLKNYELEDNEDDDEE